MNDNEQARDAPWLGPEFFENQRKVKPEDLLPYAGMHIAWSWDGTTILASAPTEEEMEQQLLAKGINPAHVVGSFIPNPDEALYY